MALEVFLLITLALFLIALVQRRVARHRVPAPAKIASEMYEKNHMGHDPGRASGMSDTPRAPGPDRSDAFLKSNEKLLAEIWEREKTQERLEATISRFKALFELAPDAVILESQDGYITDANLAAARIFGFTRQELRTLNSGDLTPPGVDWRAAAASGEMLESEGLAKDGRVFPVEVSSRDVNFEDGTATLMVVRDISRRKQAERELLTLTMAVEQSPAAVIITNPQGNISYVNPRFTETSGYAKNEVLGKNMRFLCPEDQDESEFNEMWKILSSGGEWRGEICCRNKAGQKHWELASVSPVFGDSGEILYFVAIKEDITEKKRREQAIKHMALYDLLTGLPNRALLTDRLDLALAQSERGGDMAAVLYLDLDGFKAINDGHGHETGDKVLKEVGKRIEKSIRKVDTAARMGGDEFVVVLRSVKRHGDVDATAERIVAALNEPFKIQGWTFNLGVSIGVSLAPLHSSDRDELIRMADRAMYKVKERGKNGYRYFDPFEEAGGAS